MSGGTFLEGKMVCVKAKGQAAWTRVGDSDGVSRKAERTGFRGPGPARARGLLCPLQQEATEKTSESQMFGAEGS